MWGSLAEFVEGSFQTRQTQTKCAATRDSEKSSLQILQKSPTFPAKETYSVCRKRALHISPKSPRYSAKEPHIFRQRDLPPISQNRPTYSAKELYIFRKRAPHIPQKTYLHEIPAKNKQNGQRQEILNNADSNGRLCVALTVRMCSVCDKLGTRCVLYVTTCRSQRASVCCFNS